MWVCVWGGGSVGVWVVGVVEVLVRGVYVDVGWCWYRGWVYYHISNAMQCSNTALETTALVIYDPNFYMWCPFFFWLCEFDKHA